MLVLSNISQNFKEFEIYNTIAFKNGHIDTLLFKIIQKLSSIYFNGSSNKTWEEIPSYHKITRQFRKYFKQLIATHNSRAEDYTIVRASGAGKETG